MHTRRVRWWLSLVLVLVGGVVLAGCKSKRREATAAARFYLEAAANEPGVPVVLPRSGVRLRVVAQPVLSEYDITNVEVTEVELGRCLQFSFTPAAAQALERLSSANQSRRLALIVDGEPIGVRVIDEVMASGRLRIIVDRPDNQLAALAARLKRSAASLQRDASS